jgi:hypothetical protein
VQEFHRNVATEVLVVTAMHSANAAATKFSVHGVLTRIDTLIMPKRLDRRAA